MISTTFKHGAVLLTLPSPLLTEDSPLTMDLGADGDADSDREAHSAPAKRKRQRVLIDDDEDD